MLNKKIILLMLIVLLFVIPYSFAGDNTTLECIGETSDNSYLKSDSDSNIYFNASADSDGDGSHDSPYKYLNSSRIKDNSVIYLADGEYNLDNPKTIYSSNTFVGQSTQNTIIKYSGRLFVNYGTLSLTNLTIKGGSIRNIATLTATNVDFTPTATSQKYGGAIYSTNAFAVPSVTTINNCTFNRHYSWYGGGIYLNSSYLTIADSNFNSVYSRYGGAIYSMNSDINIVNTNFSADTAYFGGVLCDFNSTVTLSNLKIRNANATYQGGAIYKMYGKLNISDSSFTGNHADFGGAIFCDNATFILNSNNFTANSAATGGNAIYTVLNIENFTSNSFAESDLYRTDTYFINFESGNYTMFINNSTFDGEIPSTYDLRDYGWVSSVKNQGDDGNCWAFASIGALESVILKATGVEYDLSEENMKNLMALCSDYGWSQPTNTGGYDNMGVGYLTSWMGPVYDRDDEYVTSSVISPLLDSIMHVQNIIYLPRTSATDNNAIKQAILKYGGVFTGIQYSSIYMKGISYYDYNIVKCNHAVVIVGWDDNYSRTNFARAPAGNGAWICKNSWGDSWGDGGYFYVSYYDVSCAKIGDDKASFTFILNDTVRYDKIYQWDVIGITDYLVTTQKTMWYQNTFNMTHDETLAAFSTYFNAQSDWQAEFYVNDQLIHTQNGTAPSGYFTFNLDEFIQVSQGDIVKVIIKITAASEAWVPISEKVSASRVHYRQNTSFISYDGVNWIDLFSYELDLSSRGHKYSSQAACIKLFTIFDVDTEISLSTISVDDNQVKILANVSDIYGHTVEFGNVTFEINKKTYNVEVVNGTAVLSCEIDRFGLSNITATYQNNTYYTLSSAQITVNITVYTMNLTLNVDDIYLDEYLKVSATLQAIGSGSVDGDLMLTVSGKSYNMSSTSIFVLPETLSVGEYELYVGFSGNKTHLATGATCKFNVKKYDADLSLSIVNNTYGSYFAADVTLKCSVNVKINENIILEINDKNYTFKANTPYVIQNTFDVGEYEVKIYYAGNGRYNPANTTTKIQITKANPNLNAVISDITYGKSLNINADLTGFDKSKLDGKLVLTVAGKTYIFNANSAYVINDTLNALKYTATVYYGGNDNYNQITENITFNVLKATPALSLSIADITYGNYMDVGVNLSDVSGGKIILNIDGVNYTSDANSIIKIPKILNAGNYVLTAYYNGDSNHNSVNTNAGVNVLKATSRLSLSIADITYGDNIIVNNLLTDSNSNKLDYTLSLNLNGKTYSFKSNSIYRITDRVIAGNYRALLVFSGSDNYLSSNTQVSVNVKKAQISMTLNIAEQVNNVSVNVKLSDRINTTVNITVSDNNYVTPIVNGEGSLKLNNLDLGNYSVEAVFSDNNYESVKAEDNFTVNKISTVIDTTDVEMYYHDGTRLNITLKDSKNNLLSNRTLQITVNGVTYNRTTGENGFVSMALGLNSAKYPVSIVFDGDDVYQNSSCQITVNIKSTLVAEDVVKYFRNATQFYATVSDYDGNPLANTSVVMNINGVFYNRTTNSEGIVRLNINLEANNYTLTIYNPLTGEASSCTITVLSRLSDDYDLVKYYKNASKYSVKVLSEKGMPLIGVGVTFNINGVFYTRTTNSSGIAGLAINLEPGNYVITAEYNGSKASNKITVLNVISSSNLVMKYRDGSRFRVTVLDGQGKNYPLQKVTFNINGVLYERTTDSTGVASLNINLQSGKYIITTSFNGLNTANTITIN